MISTRFCVNFRAVGDRRSGGYLSGVTYERSSSGSFACSALALARTASGFIAVCVSAIHLRVGLTRAQMLSLVLFTSRDCAAAMCATERSGDLNKWAWFSYLLAKSVRRLRKNVGAVQRPITYVGASSHSGMFENVLRFTIEPQRSS